MKDTDIVREVARIHGKKLVELSNELGYAQPSGLNNRLNVAHGMQSDVLAKIVGALGCEVVVRDGKGNEWVIDPKKWGCVGGASPQNIFEKQKRGKSTRR